MKNEFVSRRSFLKKSALAIAVPTIIPASVLGRNGNVPPSEMLSIGIIGYGGRMNHMSPAWLGSKQAKIVAVCDCWKGRLDGGVARVNGHYGNSDCAAYSYIPEILAREDIDGVVIATGDRMHTIASIMAAKAGKDVYCEKPHSMTIEEGRALVNAFERYGAVYQCGHQRRSNAEYQFLLKVVQGGLLGNVHTANIQVWMNKPSGPRADQAAPAGLDWDTWLGPSPYHPYNHARHHGWNDFWETGNGSIANMGCHYTDIAQWALGTDDTCPANYSGTSTFNPHAFADVPTTAHITCTYKDGRKIIMNASGEFAARSITFEGDEGWIKFSEHHGIYDANPKSLLKLRGKNFGAGWNTGGHAENFLSCIKTRQKTVCTPESSHRATTISHICNLCARMGRELNYDPITERFINDDQANRMLSRAIRAPYTLA